MEPYHQGIEILRVPENPAGPLGELLEDKYASERMQIQVDLDISEDNRQKQQRWISLKAWLDR